MSSKQQHLYSTFRFVQNNGHAINNGKRQVAARACDDCRRKKKRCLHNVDDGRLFTLAHAAEGRAVISDAYGSQSPGFEQTGPTLTRREPEQLRNNNIASASTISPSQTSISRDSRHKNASAQERLIGDLNPEAELLDATRAAGAIRDRIGIWHDDAESGSQPESASGFHLFSPTSIFHLCPTSDRKYLTDVLLKGSLDVRPSAEDFRYLEECYLRNIHPMLPCIDTEDYNQTPIDHPARILQEQVICLVAAIGPDMEQYLRLQGSPVVLTTQDFGLRVLSAMRIIIELAVIPDKLVVIRALTVMSLMQYGKQNLELSCQFFSRAVHLGYTIGIHQPRSPGRDAKIDPTYALVWSVDRMHAALLGRPVLMHESDMGKAANISVQQQHPAFRTIVHIASLLDLVIGLYRPNAVETEIKDADFPTFDEVLGACDAQALDGGSTAFLELFYCSVAILSCRHGRQSIPDLTCRNARRTASALQVLAIMQDDHAQRIVMLPLVPYAVSLALGTSCRTFRQSSAMTTRGRAKDQVVQCIEHLRAMAKHYWSAGVMAEMAAKIVRNSTTASLEPASVGDSWRSTDSTNETATAGPSDGDQQMFALTDSDWHLHDLETILENHLDPSMPSLFFDQNSFGL